VSCSELALCILSSFQLQMSAETTDAATTTGPNCSTCVKNSYQANNKIGLVDWCLLSDGLSK